MFLKHSKNFKTRLGTTMIRLCDSSRVILDKGTVGLVPI